MSVGIPSVLATDVFRPFQTRDTFSGVPIWRASLVQLHWPKTIWRHRSRATASCLSSKPAWLTGPSQERSFSREWLSNLRPDILPTNWLFDSNRMEKRRYLRQMRFTLQSRLSDLSGVVDFAWIRGPRGPRESKF